MAVLGEGLRGEWAQGDRVPGSLHVGVPEGWTTVAGLSDDTGNDRRLVAHAGVSEHSTHPADARSGSQTPNVRILGGGTALDFKMKVRRLATAQNDGT